MMKKILKKLFFNKVFTVFSGNLKGVKLRLNDLLKGGFLFKNYEEEKQKVFQLLIGEKDVFFDIGANIGLHSYFVQKKIPGVPIYAFEPLQGNIDYINEVIANNHFTDIHIVPSAVGNSNGTVYFDVQHNNSVGNITEQQTGIEVPITTLDLYVEKNGIIPTILKIDVEGAEGDVLKGSEQLIAEHQPVFVIELHTPEQDLLVAKFLLDRGYEIYRLNEEIINEQHKLLLTIKNKNASWPDKDGVFGSIVAIPAAKMRDTVKSQIS
jgi:FkbM family methyltransferase